MLSKQVTLARAVSRGRFWAAVGLQLAAAGLVGWRFAPEPVPSWSARPVAETATLAALRVESGLNGVHASPDHRLFIGSTIGDSFHADGFDEPWKYGPIRYVKKASFDTGPHLDRLSFFDSTRAIVTGYIGTSEGFQKDGVYHTTDAGKTFRKVSFGGDAWIYAAQTEPDGRGWIGGSSGVLHATRDFGATWSEAGAPFDQSSRVNAICMLAGGDGYVGALGNELKRTTDGGKTWKSLPTPQDQLPAAHSARCEHDHRFQAVFVLGEHLIAEQCHRAYVTRRDPIRWRELASRVCALARDRGRDRLVGVDAQRRLVALEPDLALRVLSPPLPEPVGGLSVVEGTIYALDAVHRVWRCRDGRLEVRDLLTAEHPIATPARVARRAGRFWGADRHHVYTADDERLRWRRVASLPFWIAGCEPLDGDRVLAYSGHGENAVVELGGAVRPVPELVGHDVIGVIERPGLLVAYGGRQHETTSRIVVARTFHAGQFRGSRDEGFVAISRDSGRSWSVVDRWTHGVQYAHVVPGGAVVLLSPAGHTRVLRPEGAGFVGRSPAPAPDSAYPFVQWDARFYFDDERTGYLAGGYCHAVPRCFVTRDGGRLWKAEGEGLFPYSPVFDTPELTVGRQGAELWRLDGAARRKLLELPRAVAGDPIRGIRGDGAGGLVVRLESGAVYLAGPGSGAWRLRRIGG